MDLAAPPIEGDASSRARALLSSLKEHRQFFEAKLAHEAQRKRSPESNQDEEDAPKNETSGTRDTLKQHSKSSITKELEHSIQERKSMILRLSAASPQPHPAALSHHPKSPSTHTSNSASTNSTEDLTHESSEGNDWSPMGGKSPAFVTVDTTEASIGSVNSFSSSSTPSPVPLKNEPTTAAQSRKKSPVQSKPEAPTETTQKPFAPILVEETSDHSRKLAWVPRDNEEEEETAVSLSASSNQTSAFRPIPQSSITFVTPVGERSVLDKSSLQNFTASPSTSFDETSKERAGPLMIAGELEIPRELTRPKLIVATNTKPIDESSLGTREDRAVYIEKLYSPFRQPLPTSKRLQERNETQAVKHQVDEQTTLGTMLEEELPVVLEHHEDESDSDDGSDDSSVEAASPLKRITGMDLVQGQTRQEHRQRYFLDALLKRDGARKGMDPVPAMPWSDDSSVQISDDSSFECSSTADSNTSGWVSGSEEIRDDSFFTSDAEDEDLRTDIDAIVPPLPPMTAKERRRRKRRLAPASLLNRRNAVPQHFSLPLPQTEILVPTTTPRPSILKSLVWDEPKTFKPLLYVPEDQGDQNCRSHGGLYCIAVSSGMTNQSPIPVIIPVSKKDAGRLLCLSSDFRCGAFGSLYNVAVRSGCQVDKPLTIKERKRIYGKKKKKTPKKNKEVPAHGGLYYMARRSGLTRAAMKSKSAYTIYTRTSRNPAREDDGSVVPEEISDGNCGAAGSLYLALESGVKFIPAGSLQDICERTGFRF